MWEQLIIIFGTRVCKMPLRKDRKAGIEVGSSSSYGKVMKKSKNSSIVKQLSKMRRLGEKKGKSRVTKMWDEIL